MILEANADACVPLSVSHETLLKSLELLVGDEHVLLFLLDRQGHSDELAQRARTTNGGTGVEDTDARRDTASTRGGPKVIVGNEEHVPLAPDLDPKARNHPKLSERELSILDGIVRGYQNKMIARSCGITEATVKVH